MSKKLIGNRHRREEKEGPRDGTSPQNTDGAESAMEWRESYEDPECLSCALGAEEQGHLRGGEAQAAKLDGSKPEY
jgi:hypothetical protein